MAALDDPIPPTIEWHDGRVRMIDQRRLPGELVLLEASTVEEVCAAIRGLAVRGAPALGVAGAMGIALAAAAGLDLDVAAATICATRPTAVNLAWGVARARAAADPVAEAQAVAAEDVARNRRLGAHGAPLLPVDGRVLTHCNAGPWPAPATAPPSASSGPPTSRAGRRRCGWTRPAPSSRAPASPPGKLDRLGIPATLVADGMAAGLMAAGEVDCVVVGADRIAANGDVANKVGTYGVAVMAAYHGIPFYVAAPTSTVDLACPNGAAIPIEQRSAEEVTMMAGHRIAPEGFAVDNRAFDVTPAALVTAIVTEEGVVRPPFTESLAALCRRTGGFRTGGPAPPPG